jgi:hypothetical protein
LAEPPTFPAPTLADNFLWRCGHRALDDGDLLELRASGLQLSKAEWEQVALLAREHGMESLVVHHAAAAGLLPAMPEHIAESLLTVYRALWIGNRRLRGLQARIIQALAASGIEAMPIKGVLLAERCYGELALRPITDIDLLVRRQDVPAIGRVMTELGYQVVHGEDDPLGFYGRVYHAVAYSGHGAFVELHWELTSEWRAYLPRLRAEDLWRRALRVPFAGYPVPVLAAADELRYLCYHYAAQHQSARLIWLVDIAELVRALPADWSWPAFVDQTIALGLATPVAVSLERAQSMFQVSLPGDVLAALRRAAAMPREVIAWWPATGIFRRPAWLLTCLLVLPSARERLQLIRTVAARNRWRWRWPSGAALSRVRAEISKLMAALHRAKSARPLGDHLGQPGASGIEMREETQTPC